jgi:hypothetical protein
VTALGDHKGRPYDAGRRYGPGGAIRRVTAFGACPESERRSPRKPDCGQRQPLQRDFHTCFRPEQSDLGPSRLSRPLFSRKSEGETLLGYQRS